MHGEGHNLNTNLSIERCILQEEAGTDSLRLESTYLDAVGGKCNPFQRVIVSS